MEKVPANLCRVVEPITNRSPEELMVVVAEPPIARVLPERLAEKKLEEVELPRFQPVTVRLSSRDQVPEETVTSPKSVSETLVARVAKSALATSVLVRQLVHVTSTTCRSPPVLSRVASSVKESKRRESKMKFVKVPVVAKSEVEVA